MAPSWRGENDNSGSFEMFYGELDDVLAAREYLGSLPYVDSERIYIAGHSVGGTLALLAASEAGRFRAAFSFGGAPDIENMARRLSLTPFDLKVEDELRLRSPITFVGAIRQPTFYFEGAVSTDFASVRRFEALGAKAGVPLDVHVVYGADHFSVLAPLTRLVAHKIVEDTGPSCGIRITEDEVRGAYTTTPAGAKAPQ
jgi:dipeptidyl aminopeptidase/acylaminoacyl peptidase